MSVMPHIILRHVTGRAEGDDGGTTKSDLSPPNTFLGESEGGQEELTLWGEALALRINAKIGQRSSEDGKMFEEMK